MSSSSHELRVLVVAGDPLARAGLAAMLAGQLGCSVVGQVAVGPDLTHSLEAFSPEVILWDLGWDPATSLDHLSEVESAGPPIVALLSDGANATAIRAAGVRGILLRDSDTGALVAALMAVVQGLVVLGPGVDTMAGGYADQQPMLPAGDLTRRELEVLQLVAEGLPNKSIADRLDISEHTVKFHVNAIMDKLGAQSRTEAVTRATRMGLILL